jgi:hypothetical protein
VNVEKKSDTCENCRYLLDARAIGQGLFCGNVENRWNCEPERLPSSFHTCAHFEPRPTLSQP